MTVLAGWDWAIIAVYFGMVAGIALWASRNQNTSADYFLAGRDVGWFAVGASLFASNIGSEHLVGLAGAGAKSGMAMAHYELHAWCILVLGWVLVPFYYRSGVFTMPEFLERRYNTTARWILSIVSLTAYVFTKVSVTVYAGGTVFATLFPGVNIAGLDSFWVGALATVVLTGIYTVVGGMKAVVYTDAMQAVVLIVGSLTITALGLWHLGGWAELREQCGPTHFNMWRPWNDPDFPWPGMLFAAPIVGLWYWCTDQYIVQRTLAARNLTLARRGTIFGSYLKLTPVFLFIVPGMIAYALAKKNLLVLDSPDQAFPALVSQILPVGVKGLVIAGLLAALMSSLSALFNSCSTLFTVDVYQKLKPRASERELVAVGRVVTAVIVVLGIAWIPVMQRVAGALYEYLQSVQAYLAPPMTAVFFLGVFWKRLNGTGAVVALGAGFALGLLKLACQVYANSFEEPAALEALSGPMALAAAYGTINFLLFCVFLFVFCCAALVVVSYATAPPDPGRIKGLTYATVTAEGRDEIRASWNRWDVLNTCIVLGLILGVYLYFTG